MWPDPIPIHYSGKRLETNMGVNRVEMQDFCKSDTYLCSIQVYHIRHEYHSVFIYFPLVTVTSVDLLSMMAASFGGRVQCLWKQNYSM